MPLDPDTEPVRIVRLDGLDDPVRRRGTHAEAGADLPNHPLCREDCPGLCPECGVPWDELPADHGHTQLDPRWAALAKLTEETRADGTGEKE